jgi:predicted dinucleotide-binding enzyme
MTIGIIGAGNLGGGLARAFALRKIPFRLANRRGPESLKGIASELGRAATMTTLEEAAKADIVVLAVPWPSLAELLREMPDWGGRIVIDATNPLEAIEPGSPAARDTANPLAAFGVRLVDLGGKYSSEVVASLTPGALLVKAFNHMSARVIGTPEIAGGRRVVFYSGDDDAARAAVGKLLDQAGFFGIDLGALANGSRLFGIPNGPLASLDLVKL